MIDGFEVWSVYDNEEGVNSHLRQLKDCGDIELACVFLNPYADLLSLRFSRAVLTSVPTSPEQFRERGFSANEEILKQIKHPLQKCFYFEQIDSESCSQKGESKEPTIRIKLQNGIRIRGKTVVVFDDCLSKESKLIQCLNLLEETGAKKAIGLVLCFKGKT